MSALLRVSDVSMSYGEVKVLSGATFVLEAGASLVVMGPSGSGKSTLLNIVGTLEVPTGGTVELDGEDVHRLSPAASAAVRNRKIGFVFQDHHLLPQCTALENVLLPRLATGSVDEGGASRGRELLRTVGLEGKEARFPSELSGGERQRVAIARAMTNEPRLLLCDEPTGNLDSETGETVADIFTSLRDGSGVAVLLVTHDASVAARLGATVMLKDGTLHG